VETVDQQMKINAGGIASWRTIPQWHFLQLTLAILAWMVVSPLLEARWSGALALQLILLNLMLVTMWANPQWRRARKLVGALWLLSLIASIGSSLGLVEGWARVEQTLDVVFTIPVTAACTVGVLGFAFRAERPTLDGIFAMVVAYLLVAILFAQLQFAVLIWDHGALHFPEAIDQLTSRQLRGELVYFSLITLATVGYGDILPVSSTARTLASTEAVIGQFYVAVVVATFVSRYTAQALMKGTDAGRPSHEDADRDDSR
jgi:hypothetical protein